MDFFKSMQTGAAENGMVQWIPYAQEPADGPEITYRPCMFPHDQEEYEKNIFEEDLEDDGSDDDDDDVRGSVPEACELCRVEKCDLSAKTKESLRAVYDIERELRGERDDRMIYTLMAQKFNNTCYHVDRHMLDGKQGLKPWRPSMIRRHYQDLHDINNSVRLLNDDIRYLTESMNYIRHHGAWRQKFVDGAPDGPVSLHVPQHAEWRNMCSQRAKIIAQREKMCLEQQKNEERTHRGMHVSMAHPNSSHGAAESFLPHTTLRLY